MEHPTKTLPVVSVPELDAPRRLLWEAADYMERVGWCSGVKDDGVCTIGAMLSVNGSPGGPTYYAAKRILQDYLYEGGINKSIPAWSDASDQETVVNALRMAALS